MKTNVKNIFTRVPISIWHNLCIDCVLEPLQYSFRKDILASKVSCYGFSYSDFFQQAVTQFASYIPGFFSSLSKSILVSWYNYAIIYVKSNVSVISEGTSKEGEVYVCTQSTILSGKFVLGFMLGE